MRFNLRSSAREKSSNLCSTYRYLQLASSEHACTPPHPHTHSRTHMAQCGDLLGPPMHMIHEHSYRCVAQIPQLTQHTTRKSIITQLYGHYSEAIISVAHQAQQSLQVLACLHYYTLIVQHYTTIPWTYLGAFLSVHAHPMWEGRWGRQLWLRKCGQLCLL